MVLYKTIKSKNPIKDVMIVTKNHIGKIPLFFFKSNPINFKNEKWIFEVYGNKIDYPINQF